MRLCAQLRGGDILALQETHSLSGRTQAQSEMLCMPHGCHGEKRLLGFCPKKVENKSYSLNCADKKADSRC